MNKKAEVSVISIEVLDEISERDKLKLIMEKKHKILLFNIKFDLKLVLCIIVSIIMVFVGIIVHEFFHLIMLVYFGIGEVEYYAGIDGGYVKYLWTDELTVEEKLIVTMVGSLFTIILFFVIAIYLYSKDKVLGLIPITYILCEFYYWYDCRSGSDCQNYLKYNPTINFTYVNNLFLGLLILGYILMIALFVIILLDGVKKLSEIEVD